MFKHIKNYWYAYAITFLLLLEIFFWFSPLHELSMNAVYVWPFAWSILMLLLFTKTKQLPKTTFVLLALVFWYWITNVLNGDPYLVLNQKFMIGILLTFGLMFPTIASVEIASQDKAFMGLLIAFSAGVLVMVFLSLYSVLTNTLLHSPFAENPLGLGGDARLWTFQYHPNESASTFTTAFCALLYIALSTSKKGIKVLCALLGLSIYAAISTTVSRTGMAVFSLVCGAMVYVLLFALISKSKKTLPAFILSALPALACITLVFLSFTPATNFMAACNQQAIIKQENPSAKQSSLLFSSAYAEETEASPASETPDANLSTRDLSNDLSSFTGRDELWGAGLTYVKERPITLLIGQLDSIVARLPQTMLGRHEYHLHSVFIETLVLAGIPGLLLYLCFLGSVLKSCFSLIFGFQVPMAKRFLAFVPLVFLVNTLMEIHPAYQCDPLDMIYFVFCGAVVCFANTHKNARKNAN